jgi:hypothetical protein
MRGMSTHRERMADPEFAAAVRAVVAQAPPLTQERRDAVATSLRGALPLSAETRKTA